MSENGSGSKGRVAGKVAIVTGGARGLGAAYATRLVAEGAQVVVGDVLVQEGEALAQRLGDNALFLQHDVTDADAWATVVATAEERFGPVSILVNNAGVVDFEGLEATTEEHYRRVVDINQVGVFLGMRAVLDSMRSAGGGSIINASSSAGVQGYAGIISYVASKWAVRGMTRAAALELASEGIRVNSIHPGTIVSPMTEGSGVDASKAVPMGRQGLDHEVAALVLYLASDESSYTTGSEHKIDGGVTAGAMQA
jgi:3alpha(or 20beta)-hydroxysteroid dehydrogenase